RDMRQTPVYILNHTSSRATPRSLTPTLEEVEAETAKTGRKLYEGAGITAADLSLKTCTMASPCSISSTLRAWATAALNMGRPWTCSKRISVSKDRTLCHLVVGISAVVAVVSGCTPTVSNNCRAELEIDRSRG